jgi:hypothetical protein
MPYILGEQRDQEPAEMLRLWKLYDRYLKRNRSRFPVGAYALATSDWYFGFDDHRAPHDAWLESAIFQEPASGARQEVRSLSLRLRLLGAYHDKYLEFFYPQVFAYTLTNPSAQGGHCDWRYDELRVTRSGRLIHEIEWAGPPNVSARWVIEASDVQFTVHERTEA